MSEKLAWENYWKRKRLCSVGSSDGDFVNKSIETYWCKVFSELANDSDILDVGTGNGILPYLALLNAQKLGKEFTITAVDLADINPLEQFPEFKSIMSCVQFIGNVDCRKVPVKSNSIDIVLSQYAIEYMPLEDSISEFYRCLRRGGEVRALFHSIDSETYKQGKQELQKVIEFKNFEFIEQALAIYKELMKQMPVEKLLEKYNVSMHKFTRNYANKNQLPGIFSNVFSIIGHTINNYRVLNAFDIFSKFSELESELLHHINRVSLLCSHALNKEKESEIDAIFRDVGFSDISFSRNWKSSKNMGIQFKAVK